MAGDLTQRKAFHQGTTLPTYFFSSCIACQDNDFFHKFISSVVWNGYQISAIGQILVRLKGVRGQISQSFTTPDFFHISTRH